jgi:hypothetical protein
MKRTLLSIAFTLVLCAPAYAQRTTTVVAGRAPPEGKNELSAQLGYQGDLGGTTPAGVKVFMDYSRKLTNLVWFNAAINPVFAATATHSVCPDRFGNPTDCGLGLNGDGYAIELLAGIKLKFPISKLPGLLPYCRINAGVVPIFSRPLNDDGVGVVLHTGGGLKYFVTPHVGLGGEFNFSLGPAFYSETCNGCNNSHNEFYRAIDFAIGAEFLL